MTATDRYLDLLKKTLLNDLHIENEARIFFLVDFLYSNTFISSHLPKNGLIKIFLDIESTPYFSAVRSIKNEGGMISINHRQCELTPTTPLANYFLTAHILAGRARIDSLHFCLDLIRSDEIPGDLIETGTWRRCMAIFMKGYLDAHSMTNRSIWLADSHEGLPKPMRSENGGIDGDESAFPSFVMSREEVTDLFERYDLLDSRILLLKGLFRETLPAAPIERLALLRLDGDLYDSIRYILTYLYDKISPRGFIIIDNYYSSLECRRAVDEFRLSRELTDELVKIDHASAFWRKGGDEF